MKSIRTISELREWRAEQSEVIFVPTMGALHAGHMSLVQEARRCAGERGVVIVSIFVNPTQFDRPEDLENYPSTIESDLALCEEYGVDAVFFPQVTDVYPEDASVSLIERSLSTTLCGATRPGHFDGVCTVVLKLYNMVQPQVMCFGKKDFQQLAIIRRMMRDLNVDVQIVGVDTVREEDGLAMSSRNARLDQLARAEAPLIYQTLCAVKAGVEQGELSLSGVRSAVEQGLAGVESETRIDYVEVVDEESLAVVQAEGGGRCVVAVAIFFAGIRLIDHITVDLEVV